MNERERLILGDLPELSVWIHDLPQLRRVEQRTLAEAETKMARPTGLTGTFGASPFGRLSLCFALLGSNL